MVAAIFLLFLIIPSLFINSLIFKSSYFAIFVGLKLENDLDFIEGYIERAREQVCVYHDDIKKTREKLLKVLGASAGAVALAGEICCISAASDIISSVSNQFMVAPLTPDNPIVGTAIITLVFFAFIMLSAYAVVFPNEV